MIARLSYKSTLYMMALASVISLAHGVEIIHVGTIREGLTAPTSLCILDDRLAVLEPYSRQLTIYTADGIVRQKVNIDGNAVGLSLLSTDQYIYGDRARHRVAGIDVATGEQFDFITGTAVVEDPADLLVVDSSVFVLDAGLKAILILDRNGGYQRQLRLKDSSGQFMEYPANFVYDQTVAQFMVFDQISSKMWVFSADGEFRSFFGTFGSSATDISRGGELVCDNRGHVFIVDRYQGKVLIYLTDGTYLDQFSLYSDASSGVLIPIGIAIDGQGLLYVSSTEAARIDIFQVNASGQTIEEMLVASPVRPLSADTVDFRSTSLTAQLALPFDRAFSVQFDFQLFLDADTLNTVAQGFAIAPTDSINGGSRGIVATWKPMEPLLPDTLYQWRVRGRAGEIVGAWSRIISFATSGLPAAYALYQNYPNPFNPSTHIQFVTAQNGHVSISVYNILGQRVTTLVDAEVPAGEHHITWTGVDRNGAAVASGIYFYRLEAETYTSTKKMVLVK